MSETGPRAHAAESGNVATYSDEEPGQDWSGWTSTLRRHRVTIACVVLIVAQLAWKAAFLSHFYYRQDDFHEFDLALKTGLNWTFLTRIQTGHFIPGVMLIVWILARVALYNWAAGSAVVLVMIAGASLAAWRLLRTLLGDRPAILIPLALYLFGSLTFAADSWWIAAVETIPLQIAIFMALNSHVRYARTGRFRHAIAAAAWIFFGLCFFEKSVLIPLLLFAVTAGYLTSRRGLLSAVRLTAVRLWPGWATYLALAGAYVGVYLSVLASSGNKLGFPTTAHPVYTFASKYLLDSLLPGLLGGPWHWFHTGTQADAFALPPSWLGWLSLVVVLAVIVASILYRRKAWRAWVILLGWVVVVDMAPIVAGRLTTPQYAGLAGMQTRYAADVPVALAIVVAVAFWPTAGQPRVEQERSEASHRAKTPGAKTRDFSAGAWRAAAIGLGAVIAIGSVWSVQRYQELTSVAGTTNRTYIANAKAALAHVPSGTVIVSQQAPSSIMLSVFGRGADTSAVLGPLSHRGDQVTWTTEPTGTIGQLRVFGSDGRLWPAALVGSTTKHPGSRPTCTTSKRTRIGLPFAPASEESARVLRVDYGATAIAAGATVTVTYGTFTGQFAVRPGQHHVYFAIQGSAQDVGLAVQPATGGLCFASAVAGNVAPFPANPIPSASQGPA